VRLRAVALDKHRALDRDRAERDLADSHARV
jgi:hypothetical protein